MVAAQGVVDYVNFRVPTNFKEDIWVQAAEAVPGDRSVVHHIIVYVDKHQKGQGRRQGPRRSNWSISAAMRPATCPRSIPPGTAKRIPAGRRLVFQVHYTPIGQVRDDRSKVGLIFAKAPVEHQAYTVGIVNTGFLIPPHQDDVPVAASLTCLRTPVCLASCPTCTCAARTSGTPSRGPRQARGNRCCRSPPTTSAGKAITRCQPLDLPRGTRIDCLAHFDNSTKNPYNPDPTRPSAGGRRRSTR